MKVVKRRYEEINPDDASLAYQGDQVASEVKATDEWQQIRTSLETEGQDCPILVNELYDQDFVLTGTYVVDGFKRWIAVQADELAWDTMECIVTSWVEDQSRIIVAPVERSVNPQRVELANIYAHELDAEGNITGDSEELAAQKNPPDSVAEMEWDLLLPSDVTKEEFVAQYKSVWGEVDGDIETNGTLSTSVYGVRELLMSADGKVYWGPLRIKGRRDSLAIVSARERGLTTVQVNLHTIDRTRII